MYINLCKIGFWLEIEENKMAGYRIACCENSFLNREIMDVQLLLNTRYKMDLSPCCLTLQIFKIQSSPWLYNIRQSALFAMKMQTPCYKEFCTKSLRLGSKHFPLIFIQNCIFQWMALIYIRGCFRSTLDLLCADSDFLYQ